MPRIRRSTAFLLLLIVVVAAGLRLIQLETVPWGGHGDVAWIGINALDWVDRGVFPYYIYELYAPEPMIVQLVALLQPILGPSFFTSRLVTASFGTLLVLLLFPATWWLLGDAVDDRIRERASLLASLAGAMSVHAIYISRLGMRAALFPALLALVVWLTVWAWRRGGWWRWTLAGMALALMQYNYIPARLVPVILALWFVHDFIFNRDHWRKSVRGWVIMAVVSFVLTLPNLITFISTPEAFTARADAGTAETGGWAWEYTDNVLELVSVVAQKIALEAVAVGFYWQGPYNGMNSPMLAPLFAIGFGVALLMALRFPSKIVYWWSLLGIPIMLSTDLMSGAVVEIHAVRQSGVLTFMFILAGVGVSDLLTWLEGRLSRQVLFGATLIFAILPTLINMNTYLNVFIPSGYANPITGWRDEQIDVDISKFILADPQKSYLISYEEYSRSNIAYLTARAFRDRHSAIDADGQLNVPNPPDELTVIIADDPYRIQHNGREAQWYQRAWVLLHDGQTFLLPPFTESQTETLLNMLETTDSEPLIDRSDTQIAASFNVAETASLFDTREVIDVPLDGVFRLPYENAPEEVKLLGYTVSDDELSGGEVLFVTLYWQALQRTSEDYEIFVQVLNDNGEVVGSTHDFPYNGMYRTRIWKTDEVTATYHWLRLADDLPLERYTLRTGMYRLLQNEPLLVSGDDVDAQGTGVLAPDLRVSAPSPEHPLRAVDDEIQFGDYFDLSGIEITSDDQSLDFGDSWDVTAGETVTIALDWQVLKRPPVDYSLFIHVTEPDENAPVAQADVTLGADTYPTGAWRENDRLRDTVMLDVPDGLSAGEYDVWIGIYYYADNTRLTPVLNGENQADGRIYVGRLNLG